MNDHIGHVSIDTAGNVLELEVRSPGFTTGLSVLMTPEQFAVLADQAEQLAPMIAYRATRSREAAKEAAKHANRGAS